MSGQRTSRILFTTRPWGESPRCPMTMCGYILAQTWAGDESFHCSGPNKNATEIATRVKTTLHFLHNNTHEKMKCPVSWQNCNCITFAASHWHLPGSKMLLAISSGISYTQRALSAVPRTLSHLCNSIIFKYETEINNPSTFTVFTCCV